MSDPCSLCSIATARDVHGAAAGNTNRTGHQWFTGNADVGNSLARKHTRIYLECFAARHHSIAGQHGPTRQHHNVASDNLGTIHGMRHAIPDHRHTVPECGRRPLHGAVRTYFLQHRQHVVRHDGDHHTESIKQEPHIPLPPEHHSQRRHDHDVQSIERRNKIRGQDRSKGQCLTGGAHHGKYEGVGSQ